MTSPTLFDFKGHFSSGRIGPCEASALPDHLSSMAGRLKRKLELDTRFAECMPEDKYKSLPSLLSLETSQCGGCGSRVGFCTVSDTIEAKLECPYPNGFPAFEVSIDVPSGRIAFANDMRALARPQGVDASWDVNVAPEKARCTQDHAAEGMIHVFVGNTCPGVLLMPDGSIAISQEDLDGGNLVDNICTDLWWFSAMDDAEFRARCRDQGLEPSHFGAFTVDVEPGEWTFSADYGADWDVDGFVFSRGRRTGPCTGRERPSDPFAPGGAQEGKHFRAFTAHLRRSDYLSSLDTCLEYCFCVLGNGLGWNGGRLTHHGGQPAWAQEGDPRIRSWAGTPQEATVPALPMPSYGGTRRELDLDTIGLDENGSRRAYPMSGEEFRPLAACIPGDAEPRWLAAALMLFRAMSLRPEVLSERSPEERQRQVRIVRDTLNLLVSLAEERGGTWLLEPYFRELLVSSNRSRRRSTSTE